MKRDKIIFFDRDGIVNKRIVGDYVRSIQEFKFLPGFLEIFKIIPNNFICILITNQQGIGKGVMTESDLNIIHTYMQKELQFLTGRNFDDIYYCTSLASDNDFRRKPNPGMILEALSKWEVDASCSWIIGDSVSDVQAGKNARTNTILIGKYPPKSVKSADRIFGDHLEALEYINEFIVKGKC